MHWILFYCYLSSTSIVVCHVYNTLNQHELNFEFLSHVGIIKNLRISYCPYCQQLNSSSCRLLVVAIAMDLMYGFNLKTTCYNVDAICHQIVLFKKMTLFPTLS